MKFVKHQKLKQIEKALTYNEQLCQIKNNALHLVGMDSDSEARGLHSKTFYPTTIGVISDKKSAAELTLTSLVYASAYVPKTTSSKFDRSYKSRMPNPAELTVRRAQHEWLAQKYISDFGNTELSKAMVSWNFAVEVDIAHYDIVGTDDVGDQRAVNIVFYSVLPITTPPEDILKLLTWLAEHDRVMLSDIKI